MTSAGEGAVSRPVALDIIGDVHGQADLLKRLLGHLGYRETATGGFAHPSRSAIYVGDLVDRGPQIPETVRIVRSMIDDGEARMVLGNHEFNLMSFSTPTADGSGFVRPHTEQNIAQHRATLEQYASADLDETLRWLATMPLWLDGGSLRVVHAEWHPPSLAQMHAVRPEGAALDPPLLAQMNAADDPVARAAERLLKGYEVQLPEGVRRDAEAGGRRGSARARWFLPPGGQSFTSYSLHAEPLACDAAVPESVAGDVSPYASDAVPVFFGHYGLAPAAGERPRPLAANVGCVDWGISKGGLLAAYRFDGEATLAADRFVWVNRDGETGGGA